jgi:SAM-dependent methyltransferase
MGKFIFDQKYNEYWRNRVEKSADDTKIPDDNVIGELIGELNIEKTDKVLDLGCGYGRLFPVLVKYSPEIFGIDIDLSMVNDASVFDYHSLHVASAEDTKFPDNYFDKIVVFGVFDVVEQEDSVMELNRILRTGGKCLITGKNINYYPDDEKALTAEKNAQMKNFPNHFTDVKKLLENIGKFGFMCNRLIAFRRRGDFGNNNKVIMSDTSEEFIFYEYCITLEKKTNIGEKVGLHFSERCSNTLKKVSNI